MADVQVDFSRQVDGDREQGVESTTMINSVNKNFSRDKSCIKVGRITGLLAQRCYAKGVHIHAWQDMIETKSERESELCITRLHSLREEVSACICEDIRGGRLSGQKGYRVYLVSALQILLIAQMEQNID